MKPVMAVAASAEASDEQLVAAARGGNDEAFEALFRRYRGRISGYVQGIVHDEGRAEDIVQETFISALRSLRASEQTIIFKPWIYRIAHNACIDQLRRLKRAEEISIDSEELNPHDAGRLAEGAPQTESFVSQRDDLDKIKQAFGGLPESQHAVLVLRELEGLSYEEIGQRLNLTRPAVESMLFRARRGLKHEYDEIVTGERCRLMQSVMAQVVEGLSSLRDRRSLLRHMGDCTLCRREAAVMGLGGLAVAAQGQGKMRSALSRVAALFPLPVFFRHRPTGSHNAGSGFSSTQGGGLVKHVQALGAATDGGSALVQKAVAVVAAAALVGGGGVMATKSGVDLPLVSGSGHDRPAAQSTTGSSGSAATSSPREKASHSASTTGRAPGSAAPRDSGRSDGGSAQSGSERGAPAGGGERQAGHTAAPALQGATEGVTRSLPTDTIKNLTEGTASLPKLPKLPNVIAPGSGTGALPNLSGGSAPSTPQVTVPGVTVPPVDLGSTSTPGVTVPPVKTPKLP